MPPSDPHSTVSLPADAIVSGMIIDLAAPIGGGTTAFSQEDVRAFGRMSGDLNPIHVDPAAARRLMFGEPVAHGLLTVCWALDRLAAQGVPVGKLSRLKAAFRQPVFIGAEIALTAKGDSSRMTATVSNEGTACTSLVLEFGGTGRSSEDETFAGPLPTPVGTPRHWTEATIAGAKGSVSLDYSAADFNTAFPALAAAVPAAKVAGLLALTRIVGMECPGARSLFTEFDARFTDGEIEDNLSFEVARWDERFNLVTLSVNGAGLAAMVSAILRPEMVVQPGLDRLRPLVGGALFAGQRALVIGGSRGLGEACAKLLALGGATRISLTYAAGAEDAERVAAQIRTCCDVGVACFDVLTDAPPAEDFSHIYYFAAPRLRPNRGDFDDDLFRLYSDYFVGGMARLCDALVRKGPVRLLQPSSVFVGTPEPGFVEYAAAKAASEAFGRQFMAKRAGSLVLTPRFPRLATDQTQGVADCDDPATVLMPALLELSE